MRFHSERQACLRRERSAYKSQGTGLACPQAEEASKQVWYAEELDTDWPLGWRTYIARQPLSPREPKVGPLRPGKDRRCGVALAGWSWRLPDLNMLITHQLHTGSPMLPAAPVMPEERRPCDREGMQQDTDLARFCGGSAIPLALVAQRTRTTSAQAGSIDHAQAAIGFSAVFMREQLLMSRTEHRAIGLKRKVLPRVPPSFPSTSNNGSPIALCRRLPSFGLVQGRSELGGTHRLRLEVMPQFQPEVPDPLRNALPCFLSPGGVRAPPVGIDLLIFVC